MEEPLPLCNLPEELMIKILLRLPVKSILRFKAVCKSWYAFLTSSTFTSLYLREPIIALKLLKVSYTNPMSFIPKISLLVLNDNGFRASDIPIPFPFKPNDEVMVEDACNGLVCLTMNSQSKIILWNPMTRKYRFIELPSCGFFEDRLASIGLGFVPGINDYKIVRIPFHDLKPTVSIWVYTLSSDLWKKLEVPFPFVPLRCREPTFACGRMHWITLEELGVMRIVGFELNNEVLQVMEVPDSHGFDTRIKRKLLVMKDCLSMVVSLEHEVINSSFEIWVMAEYGVQESWTKLFTIGTLPMAGARQPLASLQDGKLLFQYSTENAEQMSLYDHVTKRIQYFPDHGSFMFHVFNYVESLESVGKGRRRTRFPSAFLIQDR